jgi:hypothetical protein
MPPLPEPLVAEKLQRFSFGVEIECINAPTSRVCTAITSVVGGHAGGSMVDDAAGRRWVLKGDGSIHGANALEIECPPMTFEDLSDLQQVVRALRAAGVRTNDSCGLHVHVGTMRWDASAVSLLAQVVRAREEQIFRAARVLNSRRTQWTRPMEESFIRALRAERSVTIADIAQIWGRAGGGRYHGLNLSPLTSSQRTIEFRYFNGTMHAGQMRAWITLAMALVAGAFNRTIEPPTRPVPHDTAQTYQDFRHFLLTLGLRGPEFRSVRQHLCGHLAGAPAAEAESDSGE